MNYVFLSHTYIGSKYVVGSHHLAREAALAGHNVLHISSPVSRLSRFSNKAYDKKRFQYAKKGIHNLYNFKSWIPFTCIPFRLNQHTKLYIFSLIALYRIKRAFSDLEEAIVVIDDRKFARIVIRLPRNFKVIYRPTDMCRNEFEYILESLIMTRADAVVYTNPRIIEHLVFTIPKLLLTNGFDSKHFKYKDSNNRSGGIYVGAIDERFDWNAVVQIAHAMPKEFIDIFGDSTSAPDDLPANIRLKGFARYEDLPHLFNEKSFGLLPFVRSCANNGRSPMKLWEYLASGLKVISFNYNQEGFDNYPQIFVVEGTFDYSDFRTFRNLEQDFTMDEWNKIDYSHSWESKYLVLEDFLQKL